MTDGMFCAKCLSQYQEILSKTRLFGTGNCSKLDRTLYSGTVNMFQTFKISLLTHRALGTTDRLLSVIGSLSNNNHL